MRELHSKDLANQLRSLEPIAPISDARIIGDLNLDDLSVLNSVEFRNCDFQGTLFFFKPVFGDKGTVAFESCQFGTIRIHWPRWNDNSPKRDLLTFRQCRVRRELGIELDNGEDVYKCQNGLITLDECEFDRIFRVTNGSLSSRIFFVDCTTATAFSGTVKCSDLGGLVEFENCDLNGRLTCGIHAGVESTIEPLRGIFSFFKSTIRGRVEVCTENPSQVLHWIDLQKARVAGGNVAISAWSPHSFHGNGVNHMRWVALVFDWLWKTSWDGKAFVLDELLAGGTHNPKGLGVLPQRISETAGATPSDDELHGEAYAQYDELRQAYTQTAGADDLEDFSKYRMSINRSYCAAARISWWFAVLSLVVAICPLILWLCTASYTSPYNWAFLVWLLFPLIGLVAHKNALAVFQWFFSHVFLRHMLGHGVILRRVLLSGVAVIGLYALAFVVISEAARKEIENQRDQHGVFYSHRGKEYIITVKLPEQGKDAEQLLPVGMGRAFMRAAYFSTVTFTTLGYGDLLPRGKARIVAGLEALTGAFYMSMLVVVLARRHLRM